MKKFIILGGYEPFIIETDDWDMAFWNAWDRLKDNLISITIIPE